MSIPLRLIAQPERFDNLQIGDCWYMPTMDQHPELYSRQFREQHAGKRPPICMQLPCGYAVSPDEAYRNPEKPNPTHEGWTVTGELPNITVSPSLNIGTEGQPGHWHGWIDNGIMRDA